MNSQTNQGFTPQDSSYNPFDPFGLGDDQSPQTSQSGQTSTSTSTQQTATSSSQVDPATTTQSASTQTTSDGVTVKNLQEEEKVEDKTPANFQIGSKLKEIRLPIKPHNLKFDEQNFLKLLAGSISLGIDEKKRILDSIPTLRQAQIDQLIEIFQDEKNKFTELPEKHIKELIKLDEKHNLEWTSIEDEYLQQQRKQEEEAKAEEIRKKMGL